MASINGVGSSSSISGLYNSANIISGLASGLDTEGMIESLVKSYQNKIQTLNNKATKLGWKQEAYQTPASPVWCPAGEMPQQQPWEKTGSLHMPSAVSASPRKK